MRKKRIQEIVMKGSLTLPFIAFVLISIWLLLPYAGKEIVHISPDVQNKSLLTEVIDLLGVTNSFAKRALSLVLYLAVGYMLLIINNRLAIVREKTSSTSMIYLLLLAIYPAIHGLYPGVVSSLFIVVSLYYLLSTYHDSEYSQQRIFYSFFLLGLSSLFVPTLLFLFLPFIYSLYPLRSLSIKNVFASLTGLITPHLLLASHRFYHDIGGYTKEVDYLLGNLGLSVDLDSLTDLWFVFFLFISLFVLIAWVNFKINQNEEKIITQAYIDVILNICFVLIILLPFTANHNDVMPILILFSSFIISHLFATTKSRVSNIIFIFFIFLMFVVFAYNIWKI